MLKEPDRATFQAYQSKVLFSQGKPMYRLKVHEYKTRQHLTEILPEFNLDASGDNN